MSRLGPVTDDRPDRVPVADAELDVFGMVRQRAKS
jgi:hypothetical protein